MKRITKLPKGTIFTFGSNERGAHNLGAALDAKNYFGAIQGQGEALQGQSYAIATKDYYIKTLPLKAIKKGVERFILFAKERTDLNFYVTPIGCGYAGYTPEDIAPFFEECLKLSNVILPEEFLKVLKPKRVEVFSNNRRFASIEHPFKHGITVDKIKSNNFNFIDFDNGGDNDILFLDFITKECCVVEFGDDEINMDNLNKHEQDVEFSFSKIKRMRYDYFPDRSCFSKTSFN